MTTVSVAERPQALSHGRPVWRRVVAAVRQAPRGSVVGGAVLVFMVVVAVVGPAIIPYGPQAVQPDATYVAPCLEHPFGTDQYGRDVLARVVYATRLDLTIAVATTLIALLAGTTLGIVAGYVGGFVDGLIMRVTDIVLSFPAFILAMAVTATLGRNAHNVIAAVALAYTPYFVRLMRAEVIRIRNEEYCDAARCAGLPAWRIMGVHVLPNALTPAFVQALLCFGWSVLDVAGLSFLGLGIQPPTAEWGLMIADGTNDIVGGQWWTWLAPGLCLIAVILAANAVSEGLRQTNAHGRVE